MDRLKVKKTAVRSQHPMGFPTAGIGFSARGPISRSQYGLNVLQPQAGAPNSGVADNVEQHAILIALGRRIGEILPGKVLAAEKVRIALAVID